MASDITIRELIEGITIPIEIRNDDGTLDVLSIYTTVRLVISQIDFSSNVLNLTVAADASLALGTLGILNWTPDATKPGPVFGKYWLQVIRTSTGVDKPTKLFTLEVIRRAPTV